MEQQEAIKHIDITPTLSEREQLLALADHSIASYERELRVLDLLETEDAQDALQDVYDLVYYSSGVEPWEIRNLLDSMMDGKRTQIEKSLNILREGINA